jgi:hypothetical protein
LTDRAARKKIDVRSGVSEGSSAPDIEIENVVQGILDEYAEGMIISSAGLAEQIVVALRTQSYLK